jgi:hypothetical protein
MKNNIIPLTDPLIPLMWQNLVQGGIISACYKIENINPGADYFVVVTP